jgi:hypothetical protein
MDAKMGWCENCKSTHAAMQEEPIYFNAIVLEMKRRVQRGRIGDPFRMGIEEFMEEGKWWWRVYAKDGSRLANSSGRLHPFPGDALRELAELVDAREL